MTINIKIRNIMAFDCTSFSDQNLTHSRLSICKVTWCFISFVNKNCRQEKTSRKVSYVWPRGGATYIVHYTRTRIFNSRTKLYFSKTEKSLLYNFLGSGRSTSPVMSPRSRSGDIMYISVTTCLSFY